MLWHPSGQNKHMPTRDHHAEVKRVVKLLTKVLDNDTGSMPIEQHAAVIIVALNKGSGSPHFTAYQVCEELMSDIWSLRK